MALTQHQKNAALKKRRAGLRARGICVNCQQKPVKPGLNRMGKPFTCCETCLQARRDRWHDGAMPPLFREIHRSERVH